ncbi:ZEB2-regulated ABC transporter 1 [Lasiodiplodia hormozganensis]|uniref:ZEB2-regulated ABC transporter 1 n=1 Tax=Lasiodiplodia hormozganensis TaxID=869390 RepID=A0AA40CLB0_9PEZI|nr:ZEB2-regulated ABC transporter 1 [Lasiodiplodia hormozganensis]
MSLDISEAPTDKDDTPPHNRASSAEDGYEAGVSELDSESLHQIASRISHRLQGNAGPKDVPANDISPAADPELDPDSTSFNSAYWARMMLRKVKGVGGGFQRSGIVLKDVTVSTRRTSEDVRNATVASVIPMAIRSAFLQRTAAQRSVIRNVDVLVKSGEMLLVLGRPGSGCSTLLRTISGDLENMTIESPAIIHYNGIPQIHMLKEFKGEVVYNPESDLHIPHLTVKQTLEFAAAMRTPSPGTEDFSRTEWAQTMAQIAMATFGLSGVADIIVGSDFVRGVSGGQRKRVSIAEMALSLASIVCWDNCSRGLDSTTALDVIRTFRLAAEILGSCQVLTLEQSSNAIYDTFDKVTVLYEGRQIYFGPAAKAKDYFERMGWMCPPRQTTSDFLTAVTSPEERTPQPGFESRVPRTGDEFQRYWKSSDEYAALCHEISMHEAEYPPDEAKTARDSKETIRQRNIDHGASGSASTPSLTLQIKWCLIRAWQRAINDKASTLTAVIGQVVLALVFGSMFYQTPDASAGFFSKGAVLFFAVLLNALISITEVNKVYALRPIISRQARIAFYRPAAEAFAGFLLDLPIKLISALCFNTILYFLVGLHGTPAAYFTFFLFNYLAAITMACIFRTIAASTRSAPQALAACSVLMLAIVIYSGFVLPRASMHPWFEWISWIDPVAYAFEALMANEFHGREFICSEFVPAYPKLSAGAFVCGVTGAVAGQRTVSGDTYIESKFEYYWGHVWRNLGILLAFLGAFLVLYLAATEWSATGSRLQTAASGTSRNGNHPSEKAPQDGNDGELEKGAEAPPPTDDLSPTAEEEEQITLNHGRTFTWQNICYDIPIRNGQSRRILDDVSGWVQPGTLTALMGVSGAGKTTLLDILAQRRSVGVVTGDLSVDGRPLSASFPRQVGYAQQQDVHLETATVREALRFSAVLRQPAWVSMEDKYAYVERVVKMLRMQDFADRRVGAPGQSLTVTQRKLLTIGVELAAKPEVLLFLDEPTSGLDSQSAFSIVALMRRLADHGQTVLSTIHQPNATLFGQFDRLLFLGEGGKTVYFGDIGPQCSTLLKYFEKNGASKCDIDENPAEYIFDVVSGCNGKQKRNWADIWKGSTESTAMMDLLSRMSHEKQEDRECTLTDKLKDSKHAASFPNQLRTVWHRTWLHYWRSPGYVWSKIALVIGSSLFNAYSFFDPGNSPQGTQNAMFSVFMLTAVFAAMVQQIIPRFSTQRELFEVREQPSRTYAWPVFIIVHIIIEIPFQVLIGILAFACFNYNVFGILSSESQALVLLYAVQFFVFASTFAHMVISAISSPDTAGILSVFIFILTLVFDGVMQPKDALPGFWIFMYRVSPLTYWISGILTSGLHGRTMECSDSEVYRLNPPLNSNMTCGTYLSQYLAVAPGYLRNPDATEDCQYCPVTTSDQYLGASDMFWTDRWRNFGLGWSYIAFNICVAVLFFRLRKMRTT